MLNVGLMVAEMIPEFTKTSELIQAKNHLVPVYSGTKSPGSFSSVILGLVS